MEKGEIMRTLPMSERVLGVFILWAAAVMTALTRSTTNPRVTPQASTTTLPVVAPVSVAPTTTDKKS